MRIRSFNAGSTLLACAALLVMPVCSRSVTTPSANEPPKPTAWGDFVWLDTAGNASGAVQGRWLVRSLLPADTPLVTAVQRDATIRERRAQLQQRTLW